jgi:hypothetical protein
MVSLSNHVAISLTKLTTFAVVILAVYAIWLFADPSKTHACSCAVSGSPAEALARADAVFAGEVVSVRVGRSSLLSYSSADPVSVKFNVSRVWKGPRSDTITIKTVRSEVSCGYEFEEGRKYVVYARNGETGLCSRTAGLENAVADLAALGDGWQPESPADSVRLPGGCGLFCTLIRLLGSLRFWN